MKCEREREIATLRESTKARILNEVSVKKIK